MPASVQENIPLAQYTTLGVGGPARYFAEVGTTAALTEVLAWADSTGFRYLILGGGSNVLIGEAGFDGLVVRMVGTDIAWKEREGVVLVTAAAGVELDVLIADSVERGLWGLENLSAIPGTVGATPIQNVGAYGVEVKDIIESVSVYDSQTHTCSEFDVAQCAFGYRNSIFKTTRGTHLIVLAVTFRLQKEQNAKLAYKDLREYFTTNTTPTVGDVRTAIIAIRKNKFPDWHTLGTAGSFFKNPEISSEQFSALKEKYPELPGYPQEGGVVKISLGWVLDRVLTKRGYRKGNVGLFEKQALVLVRYEGATAHDVRVFSDDIIREVKEVTGLDVVREVVVV